MPTPRNLSRTESVENHPQQNMDDHAADIKLQEDQKCRSLEFCCSEVLCNQSWNPLLRFLSLTLLPILGLWALTVYSLSENIQGKDDIEKTQYAVKFSVEIGRFMNRIQRERDMSVLYLSILGPGTKTFLMNEYQLTDQALDHLSDWPVNTGVNSIFSSKKSFHDALRLHRKSLDPNHFDIYFEMEFYSFLIEGFVGWMYDAIRESKLASIWKILASYQKIIAGMEQIGIERALGAVYYVSGGFPTKRDYESYNKGVNIFKSNYRSATMYSKIIDPIFQEAITSSGINLTAVVERFRFDIQHTLIIDESITKGKWWFDNMTLYLDTLLVIQVELASLINGRLENIITLEERNIIITAVLLVGVIMMCPLIIYTVELMTSNIQMCTVKLLQKTNALCKEKKKTDLLLYQMVPKAVAEKLKLSKYVDAEYFKSVTVMFSDVHDFSRISSQLTAIVIVNLLNSLYNSMDTLLDKYEVYKVETINDSYMVASGLPTRIGNRHSFELASLAIDLVNMVIERRFSTPHSVTIQLRIGLNTGPCMAGIVGKLMPRYCLFGETVNTASRMKSYGQPNTIHISSSTYKSLKKHKIFSVKHRGNIQIKGRGVMKTYWLDRVSDGASIAASGTDLSISTVNSKDNQQQVHGELDLPGELQQYHPCQFTKTGMLSLDNLQKYLTDQGPKATSEKPPVVPVVPPIRESPPPTPQPSRPDPEVVGVDSPGP